ncbi:MAG: 50S ribosomal protein L13 [Thermoproteota archaeon]|jgi:large subunit ribosomal protein L13|uniref:Large ribosomal subunit protein uL13 n=1 Tax=Candidatus Methanodesulfokora washburnensis TaxID=2478471 RepID=A0A3R9PY62_9CREN|nr:50S ribosomal protein L13 [Candidatus Methanodesulfokores washburnensis]RSN76183.1 50S ribosomal protein L13 [Candidatus Methanodesulfokores washburnensis]RZN59679.1 MAG: 50S ribosomal protein L13 [Candidatus Methanodesulfokores washburnensis]TDA41125.1 MAG: 50S ribosomal protein L13 [Candidatus Korarchaeota archaeon]
MFDMVIDADGKILGRLASYVAKRLLEGKRIAIINAEKAVITGNPNTIKEKYIKRMQIPGRPKPERGMKISRTPDRIVWRTIRGMVPRKKAKGREAMKRLRVFIGVPDELKGVPIQELDEDYTKEKLKPKRGRKIMTVLELSRSLGWRGGE